MSGTKYNDSDPENPYPSESDLAVPRDISSLINNDMTDSPVRERRDAFSLPADFDDFIFTHEPAHANPFLPHEQGIVDDLFIETCRDWKIKSEQVYHYFNQLRAVSIEEALKEKAYNKAVSSLKENQLLANKIKNDIVDFRNEYCIFGDENEIQETINSYENSKLISAKKINKLEEEEKNLIKQREERYEEPLSIHAGDVILQVEEKKRIEKRIDELKKSNIPDENEINQLNAKLYSLEEALSSQKDTVNFYGEKITEINDKIKKLQAKKNEIKRKLSEFDDEIEKLKKIELLFSEYKIVTSTVEILEKNNPNQLLFLDEYRIKKENNIQNYKEILMSFEGNLQQLQLDFENLEKSATEVKKRGWTKKINYVFSNRKDDTYFQNKIINKLQDQYRLLIEWTENERMLINAEIKDAIASFDEKNAAHFNRDNLASLAEEIKGKQKRIKQKLNDQTNKLEKTMKKYTRRVLSGKATVDNKNDAELPLNESPLFSMDIADAAAAEKNNEKFEEDEHISFSLSKANNKLSLQKEKPTFEWTPASVNKNKSIENTRFLHQPYKKNENLIFEKQVPSEIRAAQEELSKTNYYDYFEEDDRLSSENEIKVIKNADTFLKDLNRIGNFYQIEYGLCQFKDNPVEHELNVIIHRLLLSLRRYVSVDTTLSSKAILLFLFKIYFVAKQADLNAITNFTKMLAQYPYPSFGDKEQINKFIQQLESWKIPDSPQTLVEFEQYYVNEPLHTVFFGDYIGQWAGTPIRIDLRSAVKLIDDKLDIKFSSKDRGENSAQSSLSFKLRFEPEKKEMSQRVIFDFTLQNIEILNLEDPEASIVLPHDVKATVRHVYSKNTFIQEGDVSVTGILKPFVDYYHKRKKAYRSSLSNEAIQFIEEGAEYKDIQNHPLAEEEKIQQQVLENTLSQLFSENNQRKENPEKNVKKSKSAFIPSVAKIKKALGTTAKKLISRSKREKKPIEERSLENQVDIDIEEKAKKGFFANSIFNRKKVRKENQHKPNPFVLPNNTTTAQTITETRSVEKEETAKRKKSYLNDIVGEASRLPAYIQKKHAKGKHKVNSLMKNLTHWSKLKTKAFHRTFEPMADRNAYICHIKLENEAKLAGEFLVFPENDSVQATGQNCNKLIYKEMLTVLIGQNEAVPVDAPDIGELNVSLIMVNVSANLKPEKIAEVFKVVIKQNCVPTLTGEAIAQSEQVLSHLDAETYQKMSQLIEKLEYDERTEYDQLNQPVAPSLEKSLSPSLAF